MKLRPLFIVLTLLLFFLSQCTASDRRKLTFDNGPSTEEDEVASSFQQPPSEEVEENQEETVVSESKKRPAEEVSPCKISYETEEGICGTIRNSTIVKYAGNNFFVEFDAGFEGDSIDEPTRSSLKLYENGREIGPAHALLKTIRETGKGTFRHWGHGLYFSTSDNSSPRDNGRVYTFGGPCRKPLDITFKKVSDSKTDYATFQSHNQKIVHNQYGIFMSFITEEVIQIINQQPKIVKGHWKLVRSTDGGENFSTLAEGDEITRAPGLETDENGSVYMILSKDDGTMKTPAYFYRFDLDKNFKNPLKTEIPDGGASKFTTFYDATRKRIYYFTYWNQAFPNFFTLDLNGKILSKPNEPKSLTRIGPNAYIQYPHLTMDGSILYAAWTTTPIDSVIDKLRERRKVEKTLPVDSHYYWDIHFMFSEDGGETWKNAEGKNLTLPLVPDDKGLTTPIITEDEIGRTPWLASFIFKGGYLHFAYLVEELNNRQHYVRFNLTSSSKDIDFSPEWHGLNANIKNLDGFFVTDPERASSKLYMVSKDADSNRLVVLVSSDLGRTWSEHATSAVFPKETFLYSITGFRRVTDTCEIVGHLTVVTPAGYSVSFFKVRAD